MKNIRLGLILAMYIIALLPYAAYPADAKVSPTETSIEVVPFPPTQFEPGWGSDGFVCAARWDDGSDYKPVIFLKAEYNRDRTIVHKARALVSMAAEEKLPARFYLKHAVGEVKSHEFEFERVKYSGTLIDLKTGIVTVDRPAGPTAQKDKKTGRFEPIAISYPEVYEAPKQLDDYTIKLRTHWGVAYKGRSYVQVYHDSGWTVAAANKFSDTEIRLTLQDVTGAKLDEVVLTLDSNVGNFDRIWVHETERKQLEPHVVSLTRAFRAGDTSPPMLKKLLAQNK